MRKKEVAQRDVYTLNRKRIKDEFLRVKVKFWLS